MKDNELQFDRTCHVLYSKPCKKEIQQKIALHYPPERRFSPTGAPIWAAERTSTTARAAPMTALPS